MTPPAPPDDRDDDLDREPTDDELAVHAVLDGEATAAQRRRVAGDPALRARVTAMKAVVDQVSAPPHAPADDVFEAIRAAAASHLGEPERRDEIDLDQGAIDLRDQTDPDLADPTTSMLPPAGETVGTGSDGPGTDADLDLQSDTGVVVPLDRPSRRAKRRWPALPAVAAAILVLVALGVGLIVTDGDDQQADFAATGSAIDQDHAGAGRAESAESADSADSADDDVQRSMEGEAAAGEAATTTGPGSAAGADGAPSDEEGLDPQASFPDDAALRELLEQVDPATLVLEPGPAGFEGDRLSSNLRRAESDEVTRCSSVLQSSDPGIGPAQAAAVVEVGDDVVLILSSPRAATATARAATLLHVLDPISCVPRFAVLR